MRFAKTALSRKTDQNRPREEKNKERGKSQERLSNEGTALFSANPSTWASVVAKKPKPEIGKLTLASPVKGSRPDKKLMVRLGKDSPHRAKHLFVL